MGAVVAGSPGNAGIAGTLDSIDRSEISSPDDLKELYDDLLADRWQTTAASFEQVSDSIQSASVYGDIESDPEWSRFEETAELQSFVIKSGDGGAVRFAIDDGSLTVDRYGEPGTQSPSTGPDSQTIYFVGLTVLYAMHSVDQFIDRNGLRPVVDEVRERRWVILVACAILTTYCQVGSC